MHVFSHCSYCLCLEINLWCFKDKHHSWLLLLHIIFKLLICLGFFCVCSPFWTSHSSFHIGSGDSMCTWAFFIVIHLKNNFILPSLWRIVPLDGECLAGSYGFVINLKIFFHSLLAYIDIVKLTVNIIIISFMEFVFFIHYQ